MKTAKQIYEKREENYSKLYVKQKKTESNISSLRLIMFLAAVVTVAVMFISHKYILPSAFLAAFTAIFIYLVIIHDKLINRINYTKLLIDINSLSLKRIHGEWNTFEDTGEDFVDEEHSYTSDLDIFGKNSLFQWISTAKTYTGRKRLSILLSSVVGDIDDILERQEAVKELASKLSWRQRFLAESLLSSITSSNSKMHNPKELIAWGRETSKTYSNPWVITLCRVCPAITVLLVTAGFVMHLIPWYFPSAALLIQYGFISYNAKQRYRMFDMFETYNEDIKAYYKMLKLLEKHKFSSVLINKIKESIKDKSKLPAFKQADKLSSIIDSMANRKNFFYILFNVLTLWDFQNLIALERWKQNSGGLLQNWFDALGQMEALASLAVISFENPDWVMPTICNEIGSDNKVPIYRAEAIGHPLLTAKRVCNDLEFDKDIKVLLITGSNMSGKSTYLRTAGINLVLAYAGAAVCAKSFKASIMEIYTCMRIKDNLEESISSFYAEILRIKMIVNQSRTGKPFFFLLDEIFKGTNSEDRHTGAMVLVNKLSQANSIGLVSTHDLELCDIDKTNKKVTNYHFQEHYENEEIKFDYKLRKGPSTTRNALHLMKLAGLEVEDI